MPNRSPSLPAAHLTATLYYGGLCALGITARRRRREEAGLILGYHNVVPEQDDSVGGPGLHIPVGRFERQMRWLAAHYDIVSLREFVDRLVASRSLRSLAAVTFDDGYAGVFGSAVPVLAALDIPATVFLITEAVGQPRGFWWDHPELVEPVPANVRATWLKELRGDGEAILAGRAPARPAPPPSLRPADWPAIRAARGRRIDLGVHSATHRSLTALTDDELDYEVVQSRVTLYEATGVWPEFFAYPYGLWDRRVRERVCAARYRAGLTVDYGLNGALADPWLLRRVNVPAGISDSAFEAWTAGLHGRLRA